MRDRLVPHPPLLVHAPQRPEFPLVFGLVAGGIPVGHLAINADRLGPRVERRRRPAHPVEPDAQVLQRHGEVGLVSGRVAGGERPVRGDGFLGGVQRLLIPA